MEVCGRYVTVEWTSHRPLRSFDHLLRRTTAVLLPEDSSDPFLPVVQSELQGQESEWNDHPVPPLDFFNFTYRRLANRPTDAPSVFLAAHGRSAATVLEWGYSLHQKITQR
jgi:hypothetical protein